MWLKVTDSQIVYQREMRIRWFCGIATVFIAALFASIPVMTAPGSTWFQERSPLEILAYLAFPLFISLCGLAIVVTGLYGAGPEDLMVDLTTRTYRFRRGFPLLARWQDGTLEDIEAIYVRKFQNKSATVYWVMLAWKGQGRQTWFPIGDGRLETRKDVTLCSSKTGEEANTDAQRLAAKLGVSTEFAGSERYGRNPEQVQKFSNGAVVIAAGIAFLILLLLSGPELLAQYQLDVQGQTTQGKIVERRSGKYSHIKVAYTVNARVFKNNDDVKYTDYENLPLNGSVQVTYLPTYPKTSRTQFSNKRHRSALMLILYGGWMLIGCLWYVFKRKRAEK